jgi:hypothetical protein
MKTSPAEGTPTQVRTSVDQTIGTARDTAAFARRMALRTLTVVGGAAAGTALAWWLSTTAASADPAGNLADTTPPAPETQVVQEIAAPATGTVSDALAPTLRPVTDRVSDMPAPRPPRALEELGEQVTRTAGEFGEHAQEQLPECADPADGLCGLEQLGRSEAPAAGDGAGLGRSDSPSPAPAAVPPAGAGKVATAGVDPDHTAERTATGRAYADGMPRRGSPAPGMPSIPDLPAWPSPLAPAMPGPAHTGSAGNPADSSLFAALPWRNRMPALVRGLTVPATEAITIGRVGAQPGVVPD